MESEPLIVVVTELSVWLVVLFSRMVWVVFCVFLVSSRVIASAFGSINSTLIILNIFPPSAGADVTDNDGDGDSDVDGDVNSDVDSDVDGDGADGDADSDGANGDADGDDADNFCTDEAVELLCCALVIVWRAVSVLAHAATVCIRQVVASLPASVCKSKAGIRKKISLSRMSTRIELTIVGTWTNKYRYGAYVHTWSSVSVRIISEPISLLKDPWTPGNERSDAFHDTKSSNRVRAPPKVLRQI